MHNSHYDLQKLNSYHLDHHFYDLKHDSIKFSILEQILDATMPHPFRYRSGGGNLEHF